MIRARCCWIWRPVGTAWPMWRSCARIVVEHHLVSRRWWLRHGDAGPWPGVSAPVQYGPHSAAIAVYLCLGQHLPQARTTGIIRRLRQHRGRSAGIAHRASPSRRGIECLVQGDGRLDECEVGEGLREIADLLAGRVDLL